MQTFDVIVIGQGFAGLTAAALCARYGLKTANVEAELFGGLILNVNELDPGPGGTRISGVDLASELATANMEAGITQLSGEASVTYRFADDGWQVDVAGERIKAAHVIVATGARIRDLGIPGEQEFLGRGVSHCADCDGPLFSGREAVVVGGGDSAFQAALALAHYCSRVTVIYRGSVPRARADLLDRARRQALIVESPRTLPLEVLGDQGVESLRIDREGAVRALACSGVFIFAGLSANAGCVPVEALRDATGALIVDENGATSLPHLWAIGAVRAGFGGLLDHAAEDARRVSAAIADLLAG